MTSGFCDVCDVKNLPVNPLTIWEHIPCPPPEFEDELFSATLVDKLGPENGVVIIMNIAKRCDIKIPKLFPTMGHVSGTWIFDTCGQDCISTTVGVCVSVLLVMIIVAMAGFARRELGWFQSLRRDKYVMDHISTMISEDTSEYKFTRNHEDTKMDDELSSIYVARWYKIFVADSCSETDPHSTHKHSSDSRCICKRLAEHIYEDIDSCKPENERTEILTSSYQKYSDVYNDKVLIKRKGNESDSTAEICSGNISTFTSNDYQTLKIPGNNKNANGVGNQNRSLSHSCLNESLCDMHLKEAVSNECEFLLTKDTYYVNSVERLNSNTSANSGTPLINNDSTDSESLTALI